MIDDKFDDLQIANILSSVKTIAMVGASNNWKRPSNFVMKYLQRLTAPNGVILFTTTQRLI